MPIGPLTIGAGISAGASLINNAVNSYAVKKQNEMNMANWREQNEYNSPKNQRKRMEEAGLSPAMMYGSGSSGGGVASSAPTMQKPELDFSQVGSIISTYLDLKAKDTNIENTRQQTIGSKIRNSYLEGKEMLETNILENRDREGGYRVGKPYLDTPKDAPMTLDFEAGLQQKQSQIEALKQQTLTSSKQLDLLKIRETIDNASLDQLKTIGIIPGVDDGNVQEAKYLYYMLTGNKMDTTSSKSGALLGTFINFLSKLKGGASATRSAVSRIPTKSERNLNVKDYEKWRKSMGDVWD